MRWISLVVWGSRSSACWREGKVMRVLVAISLTITHI